MNLSGSEGALWRQRLSRELEGRGPFPADLERVEEDGDVIVYRGRWERGDAGEIGVLVVVPAADPPAPGAFGRLAREYALKDELEPSWAARPLELVREGGRLRLVLEDPGGVPLARLLGQPMETGRFLRLAVRIVKAIDKVHRRGLIHKGVRPANILADEASGAVHLTGFGLASRLPREQAAPDHAEVAPPGALAYMAPEQTGRMNRSVDLRSDLYAVGVVLYEMLTGVLPFSASDPIEWVHCHIARPPVPPAERVAHAPAAISAIILKCLAKTAEDRYQTAAGLACDLEHCLAQWESAGTIEPFALGARDISDTLRIPEKLYGREADVRRLMEAFERVAAEGAPELILISGYSGVGKTSVVNELHKALAPARGLFAAGKFDQYKRDIPYTPLAQAFQGLIRQLLGKSEAELDRWRQDLRAALEPNAALLVTLVPDLKLILGEPPAVADLPTYDAERRFRLVLRRFVRVFARPEHPLALFLDDLQWLDPATLDLLVELATHPEAGSLLLIGAYRDNEVDADHPLMRSLQSIREAGVRADEIVLSPLGRADVGRLVADTLACPPQTAAPLADLVYEKSAGNPFFTIQFLTALAQEKLLAFSPGEGRWVWDLKQIRAKGYTDNVADLMVGKLARMSLLAQDALQRLALLGDKADLSTLSLVMGGNLDLIHTALWEPVRAGLVLRQEGAYAFLHNWVQEAAYSLIPEPSRAKRHLHIGQLLASGLPPEQVTERIFEIVNQLNRGLGLVEAQEERDSIAELNLRAGQRAKASTAYISALTYLRAAAGLLADDRWARRYDLAFPIELNLADCEFLSGDPEAAEARLSALYSRAANTVDQAVVTSRRIAVYTVLSRSDVACEAFLEYLRQVGIEWTPHPTDADVGKEYDALWPRLRQRPIEALIDLPPMVDPERRATLDVLMWAGLPASFADPNLYAMTVARAANLSIENGNAGASPFAYVRLGMVLGFRFGDYQNGFRLGKLGFDLVEQKGLHEFRAQVYLLYGSLITPWSRPIREGMDLIQRASVVARQVGNPNYTDQAAAARWISARIAVGDPLREVQNDAERALEMIRVSKFGFMTDQIAVQLRFVRMLRGLAPAPDASNVADLDERRFEARLESDPHLAIALFWYRVRRLQALVIANDYAGASVIAAKAAALTSTSPAHFEVAEYHFYAALALIGCHATASAKQRGRRKSELQDHYDLLAIWAQNCPANFADRVALVGAEIARIELRELDAIRLYDVAIRAAHDNGFVHNEALANEMAGRFYLERGVETTGLAHLRNARAGYGLWGAEGKVRQLDQDYPQLAGQELAQTGAAGGLFVGQLDLATLIKASQAVFGEIALPRLIKKLMTITLQNAGADRGLLLLPQAGGFEIEAEARTEGAGVDVQLRRRAMGPEDGPEAVVNTVIRTGVSLVLEDASRPGPTWEAAFKSRAPPRSAFCLPLLRQGRLTGVLYLENSQATYAFTAKRVAVLEVLATQAAIALENARLYGDLQEREAKIRRLVEANIIGICVWTVDGRVIDANDAFLGMTGYSRDDLRSGQVNWAEMTPPEWRDADLRAIEQIKATGSCPPYEKQFARKDGRRMPVLLGAASFSGTQEEGVAFFLDLSEQKESERRLKLMVDELNHRVKNTLATVLAISGQTLRVSDSLDTFREAFQARLFALSKTHDLLNQTHWTGVNLTQLVEQALAAYTDRGDGRVYIAGEDVQIGPIAAVTLGMALHELATNAAKYGALSTASGQVRVTWRPSEPGWLRLLWEELGGPPVEPPRRQGFGSTFIQKVLAAELRGEVGLEFRREGVRCTMNIDLEWMGKH